MMLNKRIVIGFDIGSIFLMCGPLSAKPQIIFDTDIDPDKLDTASSHPHIPRQGTVELSWFNPRRGRFEDNAVPV